MGGEFGQWAEWDHDHSLEWHLLQYAPHAGLQQWVTDLNRLYREEPALHRFDCRGEGFEWVDCGDTEHSILSFLRVGPGPEPPMLVVCNFTPTPHAGYRIGVPRPGQWSERLNSDAAVYGGSGSGNFGGVEAQHVPHHGRPCSLSLALPPLSIGFFRSEAPSA